jgi:hypothetical protein
MAREKEVPMAWTEKRVELEAISASPPPRFALLFVQRLGISSLLT